VCFSDAFNDLNKTEQFFESHVDLLFLPARPGKREMIFDKISNSKRKSATSPA
jgi:hypothetical protein